MENLEVIRRDYRKNSLATNIQSPCYVQSDEEDQDTSSSVNSVTVSATN